MKERLGVVATNGMMLAADEPPPVITLNPSGISPFLLIGDHAGNAIPRSLDALGVGEADRTRHIAWDIGVAALGERLSAALDAVFIRQHYSRLVIDCNRAPGAPSSIPEVSDGTAIPGNRGLDRSEADERARRIHAPYQQAIAEEIARRGAAGLPTVLIALHSFTPRMNGFDRPWHVGVLHSAGDTRFAQATLAALREDAALVVGDNEPYQMDGTDYTVPRHAFAAGLPYAELETRQDLLSDSDGIGRWCAILRRALEAANASASPRSAA